MNKDLTSQLEQLNLSPNEATIYLALLELGQTSAGELARKTKLHRGVVYETLEKLVGRELVFKLHREKIAYFQPLDPDRILDQLKSQQALADQLIPQLKKLADQKWPEINVYEGLEAYRRFWIKSIRDLPVGSTDFIAGSVGPMFAHHMDSLLETYLGIVIERKIKLALIVFDEKDYRQALKLDEHPQIKWEARLIKRSISNNGNFNILEDESVILHSTTTPLVIEVRNKDLVRVFQNLFYILWEQGKPIKK